MKIYKVVDVDDYGNDWIDFGIYLTREKAESVVKMFEGYDGFGICEEDIIIQEIDVSDEVPDHVLKLLEECKRDKKRYWEEL